MKRFKKLITLLTLAAVFMGSIGGRGFIKPNTVKAADNVFTTVDNGDGTTSYFQVLSDGVNTEIISSGVVNDVNDDTKEITASYLVIYGKHKGKVSSSNGTKVYYYTTGYNFTLDKIESGNIREEATSVGGKFQLDRIKTEVGDTYLGNFNDIDWRLSSYYLNLKDLYNAAVTLVKDRVKAQNPSRKDDKAFVEKEAAKILANEDGVILYMSNIFQIRQDVYVGSDGKEHASTDPDHIYKYWNSSYKQWHTDIQDKEKMLNPPSGQIYSWGESKKIIPSYYNIPIKMTKIYQKTYKVFTNDAEWAAQQLKNRDITSISNGDAYEVGKGKADITSSDGKKWLKVINPDKDESEYNIVTTGGVRKDSVYKFKLLEGEGVNQTSTNYVFDANLDALGEGATFNTDNMPAMYYLTGNMIASSGVQASNSDKSVFRVYSRMTNTTPAKVGVRLNPKADGNKLECRDRVVILPFTEAESKNNITVKYVTIGDDGTVSTIKTDNKPEGSPIDKGKHFTYTLDEKNLIQDSKGKDHSIVTDAKYPSKYVYGKASDTKYTSTDCIKVKREVKDGKITFKTESTHDKDSDATLYIPVELSTGKTYSVVYVSPSDTVITNLFKTPAKKGETYTFNALDNPPAGGIDKLTGKAKYVYGANPKYSATGDNVQDVSVPKGSTTYTFTHKQNKNATLFVEVDGNPPPPTGTESGTVNYWDSEATGVLISDIFDTPTAIPSTEEMYAKVDAANYLIKVGYKKVTGKKAYPITVTQPYTLIGENPAGEPTETAGSVSSTVTVEREFEYTELTSIDYYKLDTADIRNGAMEPTAITIRNMNAAPPSASHEHYASESNHVMDPTGLQYSITLPNIECDSVPDMSGAQSYAEAATGQLRVRNDYMTFGGATVLNNSWVEKTAPAFNSSAIRKAPKVTIRQDNLIIPATRENKVYGNRSYLNNHSGREGGSYVAKNKRKSHSLCEG